MNDPLGWIALMVGGVFLTVVILRKFRGLQQMADREDLRRLQLSDADWKVLGKKARLVRKAPREVRERLEGIIEVLMAEKNFEACGELEKITDEMKLVVMAQAALILVGREHDYFPMLKSVLIYPILKSKVDYREWAEAFGEAYKEFVDRVDAGGRTVLDKYGATNPAEFFAVGTETFFEKGKQLRERYPEVYSELKDYYGLDPAEW